MNIARKRRRQPALTLIVVPDEARVAGIDDVSLEIPYLKGRDLLAQGALDKKPIKFSAFVRWYHSAANILQTRAHKAVHVQRGNGGAAGGHTRLHLLCHVPADDKR